MDARLLAMGTLKQMFNIIQGKAKDKVDGLSKHLKKMKAEYINNPTPELIRKINYYQEIHDLINDQYQITNALFSQMYWDIETAQIQTNMAMQLQNDLMEQAVVRAERSKALQDENQQLKQKIASLQEQLNLLLQDVSIPDKQ